MVTQATQTTINRIALQIVRVKKKIKNRLSSGTTTPDGIDKACKALDMDLIEFCEFQNIKSLAYANDMLTLNEAQLVYELLGKTPENFNAQPLHVKLVLSKVFSELLGHMVKGS